MVFIHLLVLFQKLSFLVMTPALSTTQQKLKSKLVWMYCFCERTFNGSVSSLYLPSGCMFTLVLQDFSLVCKVPITLLTLACLSEIFVLINLLLFASVQSSIIPANPGSRQVYSQFLMQQDLVSQTSNLLTLANFFNLLGQQLNFR